MAKPLAYPGSLPDHLSIFRPHKQCSVQSILTSVFLSPQVLQRPRKHSAPPSLSFFVVTQRRRQTAEVLKTHCLNIVKTSAEAGWIRNARAGNTSGRKRYSWKTKYFEMGSHCILENWKLGSNVQVVSLVSG